MEPIVNLPLTLPIVPRTWTAKLEEKVSDIPTHMRVRRVDKPAEVLLTRDVFDRPLPALLRRQAT